MKNVCKHEVPPTIKFYYSYDKISNLHWLLDLMRHIKSQNVAFTMIRREIHNGIDRFFITEAPEKTTEAHFSQEHIKQMKKIGVQNENTRNS